MTQSVSKHFPNPAASNILRPMKPSRFAPPVPPASVPSESLVVRTLFASARPRPGLDEARCRFVRE
jgi:hypothetical protein